MEKRVCKKCFQEFTLDRFRKYVRKGKDYWGYECIDCGNANALQYHHANKDKANAKARERYQADPDKYREKGRQWYLDNRERSIQSSIEWRKRNRNSDRAASKKWRDKNPQEARMFSKKRRAKLSGAKVENVGKHDINKIKALQNNKCAICRQKPFVWHIDHIIPLSKGGEHSKRNIQMLCQACNLSKSSKDPIDFMKSKGFLL